MPKRTIFLVDGASGTGKSDLVEYVASLGGETCVITKATTRRRREIERGKLLDLQFVTDEQFDALNLEYSYKYGGFRYGFSREQLETALSGHKYVFVIVRSVPIIKQIKQHYCSLQVVALFVHSDMNLIRDRILAERGSSEDVRYRLNRMVAAYEDFSAHSSVFDEVLVNNSDRSTYHKLVEGVIEKYTGLKRLSRAD